MKSYLSLLFFLFLSITTIHADVISVSLIDILYDQKLIIILIAAVILISILLKKVLIKGKS